VFHLTHSSQQKTKSIRLAIDVMGGDAGVSATIPGCALALKKLQRENLEISFLLYGDQKQIDPILNHHPDLKAKSEIFHTDKYVAADEKPSQALRTGKDSSMRLAIQAVADDKADGVVSGGNTGALMAMSKLALRTLAGVHRPAIASVLPTQTGSTVMLDLGANLECDADVLVEFAVLGSVYARQVRGIENPTVGLLNVGSEDMKGHDELRKAAKILQTIPFHGRYVGFIEGNDIPAGKVDVVVTDGFTGNIALKVAEGVGKLTSHILKDSFKSSYLSMLGALLSRKAFQRAKDRMDTRLHNGGMFLGLNGVCVKSHGSMDALGFSQAVLVAAHLTSNNFNQKVAEEMASLATLKQSLDDTASPVSIAQV
jgi:phosphate acyltransferase